jgi:hypothetical protein
MKNFMEEKMSNKSVKVLLILSLSIGLNLAILAQEQTGSIKGTIYDNEGNFLPGVTATVSSEALMGTKSYVTTKTGSFRFPALPPGTYTIKAEMPAFNTVTRGGLIVRLGAIVTVNIIMEMATLEEEVTVTADAPAIDVRQAKIAVNIDKDILTNIPLLREFNDILEAIPGAVLDTASYYRRKNICGSDVSSNTIEIDGMTFSDPVNGYGIANVNYDTIEEIEAVTAGKPASSGLSDGAYINVVTRSGGNKYSGGVRVEFNNNNMVQHLWQDEQIQAFNVAKEAVDKRWIDGSLTFGGPIKKDKLWFFANARYIRQDRSSALIPFTDVFGRYHPPWDYERKETLGFLKMTSQLTSKIRLMAMFNVDHLTAPSRQVPTPRGIELGESDLTEDCYATTAALNYVLDQNTYFDIKAGYVILLRDRFIKPEAEDLCFVADYGDLYGDSLSDITGWRFNETFDRHKTTGGIYFTHFQDKLLGGGHEFKAGIEFESYTGDWNTWRKNNLIWYMDSRNPGNYYYGTVTWNGVPDVGKGRIYFAAMGPTEGSSLHESCGTRYGAYIQDSVTFAQRLTLNLGIRFDRSVGFQPATTQAAGGNPLSVYIGENYVRPYTQERWPESFPNGFNPFEEMSYDGWDDILKWNALSPRLGLIFDLFGNGKTALKASYSRYRHYMHMQLISNLHFFAPRNIRFDWYDTNFNQEPDIEDDYTVYSYDYRQYDPDFIAQKVDPNLKAPYTNEFTIGVSQELFKNFSLGTTVLYKNRGDTRESAYYINETDEWWYHMDQPAAQKYWIPFTAIVPGTEDYPDETVTFYARSNDAPELFSRYSNFPEVKEKYLALQFLLNKRMANGWQFSGSVIVSKAYGHVGSTTTPNNFVNDWGRQGIDTPLMIKLMSTIQLPYGVFLSAYFQHFSGRPWQRTATIRPPTSWCTANNTAREYYTVYIEPAGSRRRKAIDNLDLRIEKEFIIGDFGRLGIYLDALNILGHTSVDVGLDDIYRYNPSGENVSEPDNVTLESGYKVINSATGLRIFRLSLRFRF